MSVINSAQCDICGKIGYIGAGWVVLRDFAYIKHACDKCASETSREGGSYYHELRLSSKVRDKLRKAGTND